jgi:hypothetical protein
MRRAVAKAADNFSLAIKKTPTRQVVRIPVTPS